jgi:hypothetical protein
MLRQVCMAFVVLFAAVATSGVLVDSADGAFTGTKRLRTFSLGMVAQEQHFFVLAFNPQNGETFERYFFMLGPRPDAAIPVSASVAHIQVRPVDGINPTSNEIICEGYLSESAGFAVNKMCDKIRPGHHYRIDVRTSTAAQLELYGFNPISPPQGGNGAQPLCWIGFC